MHEFKEIASGDSLKEVVKTAFDADMDISGGWGYSKEEVTVIHTTELPLEEFEHTFAMMRAYIEMNMTLSQEKRFGSINPKEIKREVVLDNAKSYDKVTYEITAMQESRYNDFINAYKKGYGEEDFDLTAHFQERKDATLHREVIHWFFKDFV